jgi:CheY-like chemotaxis protein
MLATWHSVALVGFADKEVSNFESFFQLAARRPPAYRVQDEVLDAHYLLVNADDTQALHLVQYADLPGKVLLVGHSDHGTGWPLLRKPMQLTAVLKALDALGGVDRTAARRPGAVARTGAGRDFPATEVLPSGRSSLSPIKVAEDELDPAFAPTRPLRRDLAGRLEVRGTQGGPSARVGVMGLTDFGAPELLPTSGRSIIQTDAMQPLVSGAGGSFEDAPSGETRGDLLLVSESLVEGRILFKRFARYGLQIDWTREARQALSMMKTHSYRAVAIDRLIGAGADGNQVCRSAKQCRLPNGLAPVVIMFAPSAGSMDRIKAGLAGCDAYFSRSVSEAEFYKTLAQHRLVGFDGFEKTNLGSL